MYEPVSLGKRGYEREWELAQRELCTLIQYRCPRDMLACVRACVRLVALSVEASLVSTTRSPVILLLPNVTDATSFFLPYYLLVSLILDAMFWHVYPQCHWYASCCGRVAM